MSLMSTSMVLCENFVSFDRKTPRYTLPAYNTSGSSVSLLTRRKRLSGLIANAENDHRKKKAWWEKFFSENDGSWFGLKDNDMVEEPESSTGEELSEEDKFEAWKRRAEAISELREAQEDVRNAESRRWEDWLVEGPSEVSDSSWGRDGADGGNASTDDIWDDPSEMSPGDGLFENIRALVVGKEESDFTYEDRVFQYASSNSAKFLVVLVLIPLAMDFAIHDYVLMPFLDRYVKTVPLAADFFDVRRSQKLEMVNSLKVERARFRLEVEIGKSPPLSDEEVWLELRHKALELRDEWRLENRRTFANILSDTTFGITLFILLYFNEKKVALLKFTGYKILNNVSDVGKAFLIILITDILLGYHSESGWVTVIEYVLEHYGLEVDEAAVTIFVCIFPVILDACVKLWLFKYLPRLSPKVTTIFRDMKRH